MTFDSNVIRAKWIVMGSIPLVLFVSLFPDYLIKHSFFWVCLISLPISIVKDQSFRFPFFGVCMLLAIVTISLPTTIGIYVFVCSMLLFTFQNKTGGLHVIGLIHLFLASPFFIYIKTLVSFPIRLQLSSTVSSLLNFSGIKNSVDGNIIQLNNHAFLVDQACSGLYLLGYSLLFGTILLSLRIRSHSLRWPWLILYYLILFGLIIWGNLVRIYLLVVFNIQTTSWLHEGIGLVIYIAQILLPFYFILKIGMKPSKKEDTIKTLSEDRFPKIKYAFLMSIMIVMCVRVILKHDKMDAQSIPIISIEGFDSERVKKDVTKISNDQMLIYVKNPVAAYSADHNPMICWSGSGYEFQKIEKLGLGKMEVNIATLKKGDDELHTAWWFESKVHQTGSSLEWREKSFLNSEKFYLINVSCSSRDTLKKNVEALLSEKMIK